MTFVSPFPETNCGFTMRSDLFWVPKGWIAASSVCMDINTKASREEETQTKRIRSPGLSLFSPPLLERLEHLDGTGLCAEMSSLILAFLRCDSHCEVVLG